MHGVAVRGWGSGPSPATWGRWSVPFPKTRRCLKAVGSVWLRKGGSVTSQIMTTYSPGKAAAAGSAEAAPSGLLPPGGSRLSGIILPGPRPPLDLLSVSSRRLSRKRTGLYPGGGGPRRTSENWARPCSTRRQSSGQWGSRPQEAGEEVSPARPLGMALWPRAVSDASASSRPPVGSRGSLVLSSAALGSWPPDLGLHRG